MNKKIVAIIVAHPDDETLWAAGIVLDNPQWKCIIVSLCRKHDLDRAPKFYKTVEALNANGLMGNLHDGPDQKPQKKENVQQLLLDLLPLLHFDLIITHSPAGEYTRHLRHEEVSKAVLDLWIQNKITATELLLFAYEDDNKKCYPKAITSADLYFILPENLWLRKYQLITTIYEFAADSWEARVTPKIEAFWRLTNKQQAVTWLDEKLNI